MPSSPSFVLRPIHIQPTTTSEMASPRKPTTEEEPRGTKVSERPGWVTVIVNRKGGTLEVPSEEYAEWLEAVTSDDAPKRKKVLNKWGGRRRTMDRRELDAAAARGNSTEQPRSSQDRDHGTSTATPSPTLPPISAVTPGINHQPSHLSNHSRDHNQNYLPPINQVAPFEFQSRSSRSPPTGTAYSSSYYGPPLPHHPSLTAKRSRQNSYEYEEDYHRERSYYASANKRIRHGDPQYELPPITTSYERLSRRDDRYEPSRYGPSRSPPRSPESYQEQDLRLPPPAEIPSSSSPADADLHTRFQHAISKLEATGLNLEIAAARHRKTEIAALRAQSDLFAVELQMRLNDVQVPSGSEGPYGSQSPSPPQVASWENERQHHVQRHIDALDHCKKNRMDLDQAEQALEKARNELEEIRNELLDYLHPNQDSESKEPPAEPTEP
ncbi:hypothetical protein FRC03_002707 [Tulasnella sp. 419]|nr:hypothetical protein FRC02_007916 [Tulasnella sp. 418]KAG8963663.1 hypothetical protein FRC03_002707 [Tulasnella sp. 419]